MMDSDDRDTVVVFGAIVGCLLAALYYVSRIGFANPPSPVLETLGLSLFVISFPRITTQLLARADDGVNPPWWRCQPFLTLATIVLTALAGSLAHHSRVNPILVFVLVGVTGASIVFVRWLRGGTIVGNSMRILFAGAFGTWVAGVVWSSRHKSPLFWESLVNSGNVHHDPLYFVSIGNIIQSYGVPSTGLDGIPYTPYHYGSAWLFAQWAEMVGKDLLTFYTLGPPVVVIPLLLTSVLLVGVECRQRWTAAGRGPIRPLRSDWWAWIAFLAATIGVIPSAGLDALGVWIRHVVISESYVISLPVFLLALATSGIFWLGRREKTNRPGDWVFFFVFLPILLVSLAFLKISTMALFLGVVILVVASSGEWRAPPIIASVLLLLGLAVAAYRIVSMPAQNQGFEPFAYIRSSVRGGWWPYFLLVHLFWSWLYVWGRIREEGLRNLGEIEAALRSNRLVDVIVVAFIAIAGVIPGFLIDIHGGSAFYFSDIQRWVGVAAVMASVSRWVEHASNRRRAGAGIAAISLTRVWAVVVAVPLVACLLSNAVFFPATAVGSNLSLRRALYRQAGVRPEAAVDLIDPRTLQLGLRRSPYYGVLATLSDLQRLPGETKKETLLFIPQSYAPFWHIFPEADRCAYAPLIAPAVSGLAMVDGMPPYDCPVSDQYSLPVYQWRTHPQTPEDVSPAILCAKAERKGFSRVVLLVPEGDGGVRARTALCRKSLS